nr:hypothetical protein [Ktedonobacterales bacterium]
ALLPPEALALVRETGAYAPEGSEAGERYALREGWLRALAAETPDDGVPLPPLGALVAASAAPDGRGQALRAWLSAPPSAAGALAALLAGDGWPPVAS